MTPYIISVYTSDQNLSNEILNALHEHGASAKGYDNSQALVDSIHKDTAALVIDFESSLFEGTHFRDYIQKNYPDIKLILLTSIDNLMYSYQLLGGNIFEIVIKNQLTKSKIGRIMATLNYYNQFSPNTENQ